MEKRFISSSSSTSITAVASGKCNFCPIDVHPIQNFITDQTNKQTKHRSAKSYAMNQTQIRRENNLSTWNCNGPETRPVPFTNLRRRAAAEEIITTCHSAGRCLGFPTSPFLLLYQQLRSFSLLAASGFLDRDFIYSSCTDPQENACPATRQRHNGAPLRVAARLLCSLLLADTCKLCLVQQHNISLPDKADGSTSFWWHTQLFPIVVQCQGHKNSLLSASSVEAAWDVQQPATHTVLARWGS